MINKLTNIFLTFLLLVSNTGMSFNVHFCADVVASITINSDLNVQEIEDDCCGITEEQSQCCDDKVIVVEKKSDQIVIKSSSFETSIFLLVTNNDVLEIVSKVNFKRLTTSNYICNANSPPIFERNCQLVFYA